MNLRPLEQSVQEMVQRERQKADTTALLDADNQLSTLQVDLHTHATAMQGRDAMGALAAVQEGWQKGVSEIANGLKTEQQRAAFANRVGARWGTLYEAVQNHTAVEAQQYQQQTTQAAIENRLNAAITYYDQPRAVHQAVSETQAILADYGQHNGWAPEVVQQKQAQAVSAIHAGVIDRLLATGNDLAAQHYYEANKTEITGAASAQIESALEQGSVAGASQRQADQITSATPNLADAMVKVKAITDPKVRDATEQRVRQAFAVKAEALREQTEQAMVGFANVAEQTGSTDAMMRSNPRAWSALDVGQRASLQSYARSLSKGQPVETDVGTYYQLRLAASSDDEKTRNAFLRENLLSYVDRLSKSDMKDLIDLQTGMRKGDAKVTAGYRTVDQVASNTLAEAGMLPGTGRNTPDVLANAALFRRRLDEQVTRIEQDRKRPITAAEAQAAADELMIQTKTAEGEKRRVFEVQPGERLVFSIAQVPMRDRQSIAAYLRRQALPVTDKAILDTFVKYAANPVTSSMSPGLVQP
jgi:hypothetical protein